MVTKLRKVRAGRAVKRALRKIDPEAAQDILLEQSEVVTKKPHGKLAPGETNPSTNTKVAWTWNELCARFPIHEVEAQETIQFNWNGIPFQFIAGAKHYVPEPIKDMYFQWLANRRQKPRIKSSTGFETIIELGAGPLEPE